MAPETNMNSGILKSKNNIPSLISRTLFLLISVLAIENVASQRSYRHRPGGSRSSNSKSRSQGPNMCKVQQVVGTSEQFFANCVSDRVKEICGRPTYVRWHCCPGFFKQGRERGCTGEQPLDNLYNTTLKLELINFRTSMSRTSITEELSKYGAYTVFAPSNEAISASPESLRKQLSQKDGKFIKYHVVSGRLNMTSFKGKNTQYTTLDGKNDIRISRYAFGVTTVNCARVIRSDVLATNGIMHVIDKILHPSDVRESLTYHINTDKRFTFFQRALNISGLTQKLRRKKGAFTVMAPTDRAFNRLPKETRYRILNDSETAKKIIERHVIKGVYCASAIVVSVGLKTLEGTRLLFRCKRDGISVNEAKLVDKDIVGKNGVLHAIDTVLLPDSVKSTGELLDDMHLQRFHKLVRMAGMNNILDYGNVTLFTPTNYAVDKLSPWFMSSLKRDKVKLQEMLNYHIVPGKVYQSSLVGDSTLQTNANTDVKIKVNVFRHGITLDKSGLRTHTREARNAVIHKVDKVLIPPKEDFMTLLKRDRSLRTFTDLLNKTLQTKTWSLDPQGCYTLLVPKDRAFSILETRGLERIIRNPTRLRRFVQRHLINRMILKSTIPKQGVFGIKSMQGDECEFSYNNRMSLTINKHARAVSDDVMASNGIMYKLDHIIPCTCERGLRTVRGQYITSTAYRRVF